MIRKVFVLVMLIAMPAAAQTVRPADSDAQAELQRMRDAMAQMQQRLEALLAETKQLRETAEAQAEQARPEPKPAADKTEPTERILELLEELAENQKKLDDKLGVVESRQRDLQDQVVSMRLADESNAPLNDPYDYRRPQNQQPTVAAAPVSTVPTTITPTVAVPTTTTGYVTTAPVYTTNQTVVYTDRYVYPKVWYGSPHVVHHRYYRYHSPWRWNCGWYGGYRHWPHYRGRVHGGFRVNTGNVCIGFRW